MPNYQFEIQASANVIIEAESVEAARMALVEDRSLYEEELMEDCYISDGDDVKCMKLL